MIEGGQGKRKNCNKSSLSPFSLGELRSVVKPGGTVIEYIHNANNQRVAKKVNGTVTEKYLWKDLTTLLAVYNGNDSLRTRFEYADNRMPYKMTYNGQAYYLSYDQVGTLRIVTNENGTIVKRIDYDTFGNVLLDSNPSMRVPFGFAGGLYDPDTKLTRFGYRDYDARTGKWTAKDPIGFGGGDTNLYGYVLNDPVNFVDPEGLWSLDGAFGAGWSIQIGVLGLNHHWSTSGMQTTCIRIGMGIYFGTGGEATGSVIPDTDECEDSSNETWSLGLGGDYGAYGVSGSGSVAAGPSGVSATGGIPLTGLGVGIGGGIEVCYIR